MRVEYAVALSVFAGICAAGLTWFGWELMQNLWAVRPSFKWRRNLIAEAAAIGRRAGAEAAPPPETDAPPPK
jgi:TRAP-type C4-dicarboxylate transport system permease small subunit